MNYNIAVLKGDGIGPEVTEEGIKVLQAISKKYNHTFIVTEGIAGAAAIRKVGDPFPQDTENLCKNSDAILFGAVGDPEFDNNPKAKVRPEQGLLRMRKVLELYNNIRPIVIFDELIDRAPIKRDRLEGTDFIVIRELTGGIYFGKPQGRSEDGLTAYDTCVYSDYEIRRSVEYAFQLARKRKKHVSIVDKANVMATSRLWREVAQDVAKKYPDVTTEYLLVDSAAMVLMMNPKKFDVIVTENMFGDILTDEASVLAGSLGVLPSASIGKNVSLYEPIHGSYPQAAGKNIANPIGAILSVEMMLRYSFTLNTEADAIMQAVRNALKQQVMTVDLNEKNPYSTSQVGDFIANEILKQ